MGYGFSNFFVLIKANQNETKLKPISKASKKHSKNETIGV